MAIVSGRFWQKMDDGRVLCELCPRFCQLREGKRGACFVRQALEGEIKLVSYGRSSGFCVDPIEKKPLNHFYPGTPVLSFGTAGCNLSCKFCQNWSISKSRQLDTLASEASPEAIAATAQRYDCRSVAFTYNDPVIFYEYARDVAQACHERRINTVAVTAGYISDQARAAFFEDIDAVNVDLKAFSYRFYRRLCAGELAPVLDTLKYLYHESNCWLEITTLLIPGENDSDQELHAMCQWLVAQLGADVPLHFSAFHPDFKMDTTPATPAATLLRARDIAKAEGLQHVYVGNVHHPSACSTYCHHCGELLIERDWYQLGKWHVNRGCCEHCGTPLAGHFDRSPGSWGRKRLPLKI
ncbi:AmmeMemoRadiSam system radical SAM enzyme [Aliagarivorans taiwanensis]|uniref:AmmeMemoRadiSam system radical SAM enzyme n=1 Tax=Aliagarivorans taiwanensis TaxID=561966 RepID=UPI000403DDA5|nr:AmmeMemoRadiSam system radical SAM enzyme [Aliagarivorans taiwanensis]